MNTALEQLEAKSGRSYRHSKHDFTEAREKARTNPAALTEVDFAVLEYFGGERCATEAKAARDKALGHVDPAPVIAAPGAASSVEFPSELWDVDASDQVAEMDRWSTKFAMKVLPLRLWWLFAKVQRQKREALESTFEKKCAVLEQRLAAVEARPVVQDAGVWKAGEIYHPGSIVSHGGSGWICRTLHLSTGDDLSHDCFRLLVKRGRDGRDAR